MGKKIIPWKGAFPSFKIFGNLYFVGTEPASTHVIDTGDGLIMLDTGYQHSLYLVLDGMYRLGLDPRELKYILLTHGHIDHLGAARALVELTGAKTAISSSPIPRPNWVSRSFSTIHSAAVSGALPSSISRRFIRSGIDRTIATLSYALASSV